MTAWPPITITQNTDGTITIASAGITQTQLPPGPTVHRQAMNIAASIAAHYGRTLPVKATGPEGTYHMSVHPNGDIDTHHTPDQSDSTQTPTTTTNASNAGIGGTREHDELTHTQLLPQTLHKQASLPPQVHAQPVISEEADDQEPQNVKEETLAEEPEPATHKLGESMDKPSRIKRLKLIAYALIILITLATIFSLPRLHPGSGKPSEPTRQPSGPVSTQKTDKPTKPAPAPEPEPQSAPQPEPEPTPTPAPAPEPEPAPAPQPEPEPTPTPAPAPEPEPEPTPTPAPAPAGVTSMNTSVNTSGGGAANFSISLSGSGYATCSISIGGTGGAASTSIPGTAYATVTGIPLGTQSWTTSCDGLANSGTITIY
ncbi:MAG: hypothetical protein E6943_01875 [Actinomyces sp.]|nr:hypothetical protein [Actinomyces sp.]MDU2984320.1 hypothetical protein [Actinomyces sp.]